MTSGTDPVRWWVLDGFFSAALEDVPAAEWAGWEARYASESEAGKRTSRDTAAMPAAAREALAALQLPSVVTMWCDALGYAVLPDPTLHGGGLHVTAPGGLLGVHLDYDRHPRLPAWRRALNLIGFLHPEWRDEWGGALVLCDPMGEAVARIPPEPGRLVAFEVGDLSYHGVEPITGPAERVSVAAYYLSPAGPANTRRRALFLPRRG